MNAPQFFDFANVANKLNDSDDFFHNYVCKSAAKLKKKLKLGEEDTSKDYISGFSLCSHGHVIFMLHILISFQAKKVKMTVKLFPIES